MSSSTLLPLGVALVLAVVATTAHRRLPPPMAARTLVTATAVIVAAGLPTLWVLSLAFLAHVPVLGHGLRWCAEAFGAHQRVPAWAGVSALVVSSFGAARAVRVLRTQRRLRQDRAGAPQVIDNPEAFAFTLPGTGGQIVLSNGLVQLLDDDERDIVVAHERAHASFRHDRYVLAAQLANALLPPLRPLSRRLRFSLERWADDVAAAHCDDRHRVATTLARVALHGRTPAAVAGFNGLGVAARVAALLDPPARSPRVTTIAFLWIGIGLTACLAAVQLHHLSGLVVALCPD